MQQLLDEAKVHLAKNKYNEALQCYDKAADKDASNYMIYFRRAATHLTIGRVNNALRDFGRVLDIRPNFDQALLQRGKLLLKSCSLDAAIADLNLYLQSNPADASAIEALTDAQNAEADIANLASASGLPALETLSRLAVTCPLAAEYRMKRIDIYLQMGEFEMACGDLTRIAQLHPDDTAILTRLAKLQITHLGEPASAQQTLKQCLHQDPEQKDCKRLFRELKKLDKSIGRVDFRVAGNDWKGVVGLLLGDGEVGGGIVEEAERVGSLDHRRRIYAAACNAYIELKDATKALQWCSKALEVNPENSDALCGRAEAYLLSEDFEEAVRDYEKAHNINQQDRRVNEGFQKAQRLLAASKRKDYYKILNVPRTASKRDIKKAYRKLAQEWHPDKYKGDLSSEAVLKKMSAINEAYETLSDDEKRQMFDNGVDPNDNGGQQAHTHQGHPFFFHQGGGGGSPFGGGGHPFGGGNPFGGQFHFQF